MFHRERAIRAGAALVMLGGAAAVTYLWAGPHAAEGLSSPSQEQVRATETSVTPGRAAGTVPIAIPASSSQQVASTRPPATNSDSTPSAVPMPGVGASAAMRDVGQIVISAVNGGTPTQMAEAVKLMSMCRFNPELLQIFEKMKANGRLSGEAGTLATEQFSAQGRQCQSIPPDLMPREKELAERALLGGARGVGVIYAGLVDFDPPTSMRRPLGEALRADFLDGDSLAPLFLVKHADLFELSRIETRAYEIAFDAANTRMKDALNQEGFKPPSPPLTDEERQQAETLAQSLVGRAKLSDPPRRRRSP